MDFDILQLITVLVLHFPCMSNENVFQLLITYS